MANHGKLHPGALAVFYRFPLSNKSNLPFPTQSGQGKRVTIPLEEIVVQSLPVPLVSALGK